jgi:hypothetical protein
MTALACSEDMPTEPIQAPPTSGAAETCSSECVLATSVAPFRAARFHADSVNVPVQIGVIEVSGRPGARITLMLDADLQVLQRIGGRARLLVERNGVTRAFPLGQLQREVTVHSFGREEVVRLQYSLERQVNASVAEGRVRLIQRLTGAATVVSARRRWMSEAGPNLALQSLATCNIFGPTTTACDNTVTTSPYASGEILDATFQSNPGFGASQPITITFAKPVRAVTIKIYDSDCSGNHMIASDAGGIVGSLTFSFDNQPGNDAVNETRTITAPEGRQITKVELIPDPCEYVAYSGGWEPLCAPTGDPVLDDPDVRQGLSDELFRSRPNPDGTGRIEHRGYLYQESDGSYLLVPANDPTGTMCGFTFEDLPIPPEIEGATFVGDYHTHPNKHREVLTGCVGQPPGEIWRANRKANTGGGSDGDWDFANVRGKSHYIVDIDGKVWRLDANTLPDARKNNPNRWTFVSGDINGCINRA